MKNTALILKYSKSFWEWANQDNIDLSILLDIYSKTTQTKK